ncbi:hypothetical protein L1987_33087 [Smallanthus sonchifolius]|uniref:Uncharacterized protein n=1 Tax=Smallanthus sonchifolius TaxID=185202 RepID=A0ACB9HR97_9ASTR|nr:hypothetical protein L1987_33087 [Smallanthus sonchifolius]
MSSCSDPIVITDSDDEKIEYDPASETKEDPTEVARADDLEEIVAETPEAVEPTDEPVPKRHKADTGEWDGMSQTLCAWRDLEGAIRPGTLYRV